MAIQYNFLKPIDQKVRDQGYDFVSLDEYLQDGFKPTSGISYEGDGSPVSYANSGIMSGYMTPPPIIYPPINQGGGDGPSTGPAVDNSQFDYETEAYGLDDLSAKEKGLTDEEQEDLDNVKSANVGLTGAMKAAFALNTLGPFAAMHSLSKSQKKAEDAAIEAATYGKAHRYDGRSNEYGTHTSTMTNAQAQANQDRGRGNTGNTGGFSSSERGAAMHGADGGRVGYFFGGRVNYKTGGRTDAESQYGANSVGSYDSSQNKSGRQQSYGGDNNNNPPVSTGDNNKIVTTDFISKDPSLTIDYTDPRNYASVYGKIGFDNILDNDDLTAAGNVTGEIGPVSYNTNFTDQGITGTNLTAGNFNADIDANKNYSLGYANNYNGIDYGAKYDNNGNLMFSAGVNFKNGGLASIL